MKNELMRCLAAKHRLTAKQLQKAVDKYLSVMLVNIGESILDWGFQDDQLSLPLTDMRGQIGRITTDQGEQWILPLMLQNPDTALVLVDFKGQLGKYSRVSLNPKYKQQIMDELLNLHKELSPRRLREMKAKADTFIRVDPLSLDSFIRKTTETYRNAKDQKYKDALHQNIMLARQLVQQIEVDEEDQFVIGEYWEMTDSGRAYGHGLSLQRVPQVVRHAALGRCHKYDFKASAYALLTGLALQYEPELQVADLTDYIKDRSLIRKSLAKQIGVSEDWMKTIFSAIGFGAKVVGNPYNAIAKMLGATKNEMLMANKQFQNIKAAFDRVTAVVLANHTGEFELEGRVYSAVDSEGKKRDNNQKLAWIYQVLESTASAEFAKLAAEQGHVPVLWTHDCLYYKEKLPSDVAADVGYFLRKRFPLINFEYEGVWPIQADEDMGRIFSEADELTEQHRKFIEAEERKAGPREYLAPSLEADGVAFDDLIAALNPDMKRGLGPTFNPMDRFQ